jgi:hypothetical protein
MTVRFILATTALLASACTNLQADYDNAARARCREITNQFDRQECMARVDENSRIQREEQRRQY